MSAQGEPEKARSLLEESLAIGRELKDGFWIANCLRNLGHIAFWAGDYSAAACLWEATLEAYQQSGYKPAIGLALFLLGEVARRQSNEVRARAFYNDALAIARSSPAADDWLASALDALGRAASDSDNADEARRCFHESLAIRRKLGAKNNIASTLKKIGDLARVEGDSEQANRSYAECLELARESEDREALARLLGELGKVALDQFDDVKALGFWSEQMTIHRDLEAKAGIASSLSNFALVAHYQGRFEEAFSLFEEAGTICGTLGYTPGIAHSLRGCATVEHAQGGIENARALSEQSLAMFRRVTAAGGLSDGYSAGIDDVGYASQCVARAACAQGDIQAARAALNESAQIFRQTRDKRGIAECLAGFAKVARAENDATRAARLFGAAESLHKIVGPRLSPVDHHDHARVVAEVRSALGEGAFAAAWAEGRAMTWGQAIAYSSGESETAAGKGSLPTPPNL